MSGEERRREIVRYISESREPVSGGKLAEHFQVSRQVIVQDIALIRAEGQDILSTNRGYLRGGSRISRIFYVLHDGSRIEEELNLIVDCGGCVQDVFVKHKVYGELRAELGVDSRKKVKAFLADMEKSRDAPLNSITSGYHYHTVLGESEEVLDEIGRELQAHGFLAEPPMEEEREGTDLSGR